MNYYYRTGPFQKDVDSVLSEAKTLTECIELVLLTDKSLEYLNHQIINNKIIVRFNSPRFPIYERKEFYSTYLESL